MKLFFLKQKHWILFTLIVGIPAVLSLTAIVQNILETFNKLIIHPPKDLHYLENEFRNTFLIIKKIIVYSTPFSLLYYLWMYSIGTTFNKFNQPENKINIQVYHAVLAFAILCSATYFVYFYYYYDLSFQPNWNMFIIYPFQLILLAGNGTFAYLTAKSFKNFELNKNTSFKEVVEDMVLILFAPVGLWILQPRINKYILEKTN